jgi:hypothetical protein
VVLRGEAVDTRCNRGRVAQHDPVASVDVLVNGASAQAALRREQKRRPDVAIA